jgi:hypothetical protein
MNQFPIVLPFLLPGIHADMGQGRNMAFCLARLTIGWNGESTLGETTFFLYASNEMMNWKACLLARIGEIILRLHE